MISTPGVNPPPNTAEYQRANYGDYTTNEERERQIAEQQWAMQQEAERAAYQQQAAQQAHSNPLPAASITGRRASRNSSKAAAKR